MGSFELVRANIGNSIIGAIVIEIIVGISYLIIFFSLGV